MKECKYCRSMYEDSLSACPNCGGNKIVTSEERAEEAALKQKEKENRESAIAAPLKMRKNILIGIGVVIAIIIAIITIASINANKPYSDGTTKDEATNLLETGMDYFNSGDYEAAIEYFSQLPSDSKEYEEAQSMIKKSSESYCASILAKVDTYFENEEYEIALEMIKNAQKVLPSETKLQNAYNETYNSYVSLICNNAKAEAKVYADKEDYLSAMKTIETALNKIPSEAELSALYTQYSSNYEGLVIKNADAALKEQGYEAAIKIARDGLNNLPNSSKIENAISNFETYAPVYLLEDIDYLRMSDSLYTDTDSIKDNEGIEYSGHYRFHNNNLMYESSVSFQIDKKYTKFFGTAILPYGARGTYKEAFIRVYGDDRLLYQTKPMTMGFKTDNFTIDVSGVSILEIRFENENGIDDWVVGYLTNAYLTK